MSSLYELERENILERTEMGRKMYVMNGGKLGRKVGTTENRSDFLKKEKTQEDISLLERGLKYCQRYQWKVVVCIT